MNQVQRGEPKRAPGGSQGEVGRHSFAYALAQGAATLAPGVWLVLAVTCACGVVICVANGYWLTSIPVLGAGLLGLAGWFASARLHRRRAEDGHRPQPASEPSGTGRRPERAPTRLTLALIALFIWVPVAGASAVADLDDDAVAATIAGLIIISSLAAFAAVATFALHALGNRELSPSERNKWALLLVLAWPIAAPWYWAIERRHALADSGGDAEPRRF